MKKCILSFITYPYYCKKSILLLETTYNCHWQSPLVHLTIDQLTTKPELIWNSIRNNYETTSYTNWCQVFPFLWFMIKMARTRKSFERPSFFLNICALLLLSYEIGSLVHSLCLYGSTSTSKSFRPDFDSPYWIKQLFFLEIPCRASLRSGYKGAPCSNC